MGITERILLAFFLGLGSLLSFALPLPATWSWAWEDSLAPALPASLRGLESRGLWSWSLSCLLPETRPLSFLFVEQDDLLGEEKSWATH